MSRSPMSAGLALLALSGLALPMALPAVADPGDTHKVTGERVNLRAGPSEQAQVRSTVGAGDELIELRREGQWLGVRVARTGEEGWVFSDLVRQEGRSTLGGAGAPPAGLARLSPGFERLVAQINDHLGYPMVDRIEQGRNNTLQVVPTQDWLYNTSREAKLYAALAFYQMWKSHNDGRPVNLALGSGGNTAITIQDGNGGPELTLPMVGSSR